MNSPSAITKNKNDLSCNTSSTSAGDQIDNDCDGLIDEEKANNKDDDNDNLIDEDLENIEAANASIFMCQVYSAPSPSRKISVSIVNSYPYLHLQMKLIFISSTY